MSSAERGWALKFGFALALFLSMPYLMGYFSGAGGWVFSGFLFGVEDGNSYIAKMVQGSTGAWLFRSPYSTMGQEGVLVFLPYLLLGKLAAGPALHEQLVGLFHIFRVAASMMVAWAVYRTSAVFLANQGDRRWVTAVALTGGGLGWLIGLFSPGGEWLGSLPLDLISPESFGFLSVFGLPHLAVARALGLLGLVSYLGAQARSDWGWLAGLFLAVSALFQPLTAVTVCVLIAAHQLSLLVAAFTGGRVTDWGNRLRAPLGAAAVVGPYLVYLAVNFSTDPYLVAWTEQNRLNTPHPAHYLAAYGVLIPFAIAGAGLALRKLGRPGTLLVLWVLLLPVLAYAPLSIQRRLSEGIWVALAITSALGIERLFQSRVLAHWVRLGVLVLVLPTSFLIFVGALSSAGSISRPTFLPAEQVAAYDWLADNAEVGSAVLTTYQTANPLPAYAPVRVAVGHGPESVGLLQNNRSIARYLAMEMSTEEARGFIAQHDFDYLLMGPYENGLAEQRPPYPEMWLLKYSVQGWSVYARAPTGISVDP